MLQFKDSSPCLFLVWNKVWRCTGLSLNTAHLLTLTSSHLQCVCREKSRNKNNANIHHISKFLLVLPGQFLHTNRMNLEALIKNVWDARSTILPLPCRIDLNISMWSATEHYPAYASEFTVESETLFHYVALLWSTLGKSLADECFVWYIFWTAVGQYFFYRICKYFHSRLSLWHSNITPCEGH